MHSNNRNVLVALNGAFGIGAALCLVWKLFGVVKAISMRTLNGGASMTLFTTWLVDYSHGYVRRGLCGQIIRWLYETAGVEPQWTIIVLSAVLYGVLVILCFVIFSRHKWCWWPIMMTICLGGLSPMNRDALVLLTCMACYWVAGHVQDVRMRYASLNLLIVLLVNIHEIGFFLVFPFLVLLSMGDQDVKLTSIMRPIVLSPTFMAFVAVAFFRGNADVAAKIADSWRASLPSWWNGLTTLYGINSDVGSAGGHVLAKTMAILGGEWHGIPNFAYLLCGVVAFYAIVTVLPFCKDSHANEMMLVRVLLTVQILSLAVAFPFFFDYSRLFGFCSMSTLMAVALVPPEKWLASWRAIKSVFGCFLKWNTVQDAQACDCSSASKVAWMWFVVSLSALFVGFQPISFDIATSFSYSYVGMLFRAFRDVLYQCVVL